ncbi:GntR family transcriptional regulator [Neisseriaceae bacterium PsAf]|nr:GntR family transcriptional regulator [Neisseriaceae bacterium PsAf]
MNNKSDLSAAFQNVKIPYDFTRDYVEEKILEAILTNRIPAGTSLRQEELSRIFNVSRTPVREALRQLASKGFLVEDTMGLKVATLDDVDTKELKSMRILLEQEIIKQALNNNTNNEDAFQKANNMLLEINQLPDYIDKLSLRINFLLCLFKQSQNQLLLEHVQQVLQKEKGLFAIRFYQKKLSDQLYDNCYAFLQTWETQDLNQTLKQHTILIETLYKQL